MDEKEKEKAYRVEFTRNSCLIWLSGELIGMARVNDPKDFDESLLYRLAKRKMGKQIVD